MQGKIVDKIVDNSAGLLNMEGRANGIGISGEGAVVVVVQPIVPPSKAGVAERLPALVGSKNKDLRNGGATSSGRTEDVQNHAVAADATAAFAAGYEAGMLGGYAAFTGAMTRLFAQQIQPPLI